LHRDTRGSFPKAAPGALGVIGVEMSGVLHQ
jgi:hypothetical protein